MKVRHDQGKSSLPRLHLLSLDLKRWLVARRCLPRSHALERYLWRLQASTVPKIRSRAPSVAIPAETGITTT